jgi:hypothetical protein
VTLPLIHTLRDFREFVAAKKRKREPVFRRAHGVVDANYDPRSFAGFQRFRAALRGVGDWGQASERVDALELALQRRNGVVLPVPRRIVQNADRSLTLFWSGAMVRCLPDGFISMIGGVDGAKATRVTNELLDLLAFQARIQRAS